MMFFNIHAHNGLRSYLFITNYNLFSSIIIARRFLFCKHETIFLSRNHFLSCQPFLELFNYVFGYNLIIFLRGGEGCITVYNSSCTHFSYSFLSRTSLCNLEFIIRPQKTYTITHNNVIHYYLKSFFLLYVVMLRLIPFIFKVVGKWFTETTNSVTLIIYNSRHTYLI